MPSRWLEVPEGIGAGDVLILKVDNQDVEVTVTHGTVGGMMLDISDPKCAHRRTPQMVDSNEVELIDALMWSTLACCRVCADSSVKLCLRPSPAQNIAAMHALAADMVEMTAELASAIAIDWTKIALFKSTAHIKKLLSSAQLLELQRRTKSVGTIVRNERLKTIFVRFSDALQAAEATLKAAAPPKPVLEARCVAGDRTRGLSTRPLRC